MGERTIFADEAELFDACEELLSLARERGLTLGSAESCTGGLVCGCLTSVPGSSDVVRGSVVSYAIPVKREVLGVDGDVLDAPELGAVSGACAEQMAEGARRVLGCELAVSVSGIAGPGGEEPGKPVGTVWMGLSSPAGTTSRVHLFEGDRSEVRHQAVRCAVSMLREGVMEVSGLRSR